MAEPRNHVSSHADAQAHGHALNTLFLSHALPCTSELWQESFSNKQSSTYTYRQLRGRTARPPRWRGSSAACSRLLPSP
jgi:hypothetical protein